MRALTRLLELIVWTGFVLTGAATVAAFFATAGWPVELFSHFAVQYAAVSIVSLVYFALRRSWWVAFAALVLLAINGSPLWPYYQAIPKANGPSGSRELRILVLNLNIANGSGESVRQLIEHENPDVMLFHEVSTTWARVLEPIRATHSYVIGEPSDSIFGILLMSRLPIRQSRVLRLGPRERAAIQATICGDRDDRCLTIIGAHPPPPLAADWSAERDMLLLQAARIAKQTANGPVVLAGDFNVTPWSPVFPDILADSNLRDSALGFGIHSTWLSRLLPFGLPIDHILVSPDINVMSRHVGPYVGSDHFPVVADLAF